MKLRKNLFLQLFAAAVVLLCLLALPQNAQAASESDLTFKLNSDETSYSLSKCDTAATGELVIPATYNGLPVTAISNYALQYCDDLTSVTIPSSITTIGKEAFYRCKLLTEITIPGSVTTIGSEAFSNCIGLTSVTISEGVMEIGSYAFLNCCNVTSVTIPSTVTKFGYNPFTYSNSLKSLQVAKGNPVYHSAGNCIIETAKKTLVIGCPVSKIPTDGSVTVIGVCAFENCDVLTTITIPNTITVIEDAAFWDCDDLASITIPGSVTAIGDEAFYNCLSLTEITVPSSVTSIGQEAFGYCTKLTKLQVASGNPVYHSAGNCVIETASKTLVIGCPVSKIPTDGSVTAIGEYAFSHCGKLTEITIPNTITVIESNAFEYCQDLTEITIPGTVTTIGAEAFSNCYLTGVTIEKGVTTIDEGAFKWCSKLTEIVIPDSVTTIGAEAFYYCTKLETAAIPDSVTAIGKYAFNGCSKLTNVIYCGTQDQWNGVAIGGNNDPLTGAALQFHNYQNGKCTYCPATNGVVCQHTWQPATCDAPKTCALCQATEGTALGHNMQETAAKVAATCEKAGKTAVTTCANGCGKTEGGEEIPALGHNMKESAAAVAPTCTAAGKTAVSACANCGKTEGGETVPATGHNYVNGTCSNCGHKDDSVLTFVLNSYGNGYYVQACDPAATGKVVVPATYNGLPVTGVAERAFWKCEGVTSVVIEEGSLAIGAEAFGFCTGLKSITLPESLLAIDMGAFWACTSLTNLTIPQNVFSIENSIIGYCDSLKTVQVAKENQTYHSAGNCIINTESKTLIAACNSSKLPTDGSVTGFGYYAYAGCTDLTSYTIPKVITSILGNPFAHCDNLTTLKVASGHSVFHSAGNCVIETATKTLTVGCQTSKLPTDGSVTIIGFAPFENCNKLTSITIPNTVTIIGDGAFWGCDAMTEITIPGSVTGIGLSAFGDCTSLTKVTFCGTQEQWNAISLYEGNEKLTGATLQLHNYKNGKCAICGEKEVCNHSWTEATCTQAATCKLCGEVNGTAPGHKLVDGVCSVCGQGGSLLGDANGDGKINLRDAIMVLQAVNGKDVAIDRAAADVTGDGKVNLADAIRILKRANGNKDPFPAEK